MRISLHAWWSFWLTFIPSYEHVQSCNLGAADDNAVWEYAKAHGFAIVSKDSDFAERSVLAKDSPKIVWIRTGNCSTAEIETLLRSANEMIRRFIEDEEETCLLLSPAHRSS